MTTITKLDPRILGLWTRYIRDSLHWSQEALAEASGLTARTIQRVEAGQPVNITTRRALARALGYENQDVFDDPAFIKQLEEILETQSLAQKELFEQQLPDQIRVCVQQHIGGWIQEKHTANPCLLPRCHVLVTLLTIERISS